MSSEALLFLVRAGRAIVELIGLCLIGQGMLHLIAGQSRHRNPIYRAFSIVTAPPRQLVAHCLPTSAPAWLIAGLLLLILFILWIGLAFVRQAI